MYHHRWWFFCLMACWKHSLRQLRQMKQNPWWWQETSQTAGIPNLWPPPDTHTHTHTHTHTLAHTKTLPSPTRGLTVTVIYTGCVSRFAKMPCFLLRLKKCDQIQLYNNSTLIGFDNFGVTSLNTHWRMMSQKIHNWLHNCCGFLPFSCHFHLFWRQKWFTGTGYFIFADLPMGKCNLGLSKSRKDSCPINVFWESTEVQDFQSPSKSLSFPSCVFFVEVPLSCVCISHMNIWCGLFLFLLTLDGEHTPTIGVFTQAGRHQIFGPWPYFICWSQI